MVAGLTAGVVVVAIVRDGLAPRPTARDKPAQVVDLSPPSQEKPVAAYAPLPAPHESAPESDRPADRRTVAPASPPSDEAAMMDRLRALRDRDPEAAVELARAGADRFGESALAPERTSILIHALAGAGRAGEARGEAEDMVNRYPESPWVSEVEQFTGAHRHRNVRITEDGSLETY